MSDNHYPRRSYHPHPEHSYSHNPPPGLGMQPMSTSSMNNRDQQNPYPHQQQHPHHPSQQHPSQQHPSQQHPQYLQQQQEREQHHQQQYQQHHPHHPYPHPGSRHHPHHPHPIPPHNSNNTVGSNSSISHSSSSNKRPAPSSSLSSSMMSTSSPSQSSQSRSNIVATTPPSSSSLASSRNNNTASTASITSRSNKKAKKSSPSNASTARSSPTGESTKSSGTGTTSAARGLRHFSMMVCQKVEEKGTTTYNEVADELVKKVVAERRKEDPNGKFDEKNIRRRVYDALNVLMAMDIISKEKKEITWKGLPTAAKQDMDSMKKEIEYRKYQIEQKRESLRDLLIQQVCFRNLVQRNHDRGIVPDEKIPLPFIVVNTNQSAVIQCDMSGDRTDVMFDFSLPFEINDDNTILKKMQM
jgi:hypothetical protein